MVIMCLILLLAGGLSLLLLKRRCKKTQGSASSDQRNTGDGDEVSSSAYYAMIPDSGSTTLHPSVQKPISLNTVYDTAHLPTNPSGSDFYTLAEQPQNMTYTSESMSPKPTTTRALFHTSKPATADTASSRPVTSSSSSSSSSVLMFFSSSANAVSPKPQLGVRLRGVIRVLVENLSAKEATHTVCHYEEIICTDSYGLGLSVFDVLNTYSTVIFQTTDHPDRTSDGQETCDSATVRKTVAFMDTRSINS
ncbi:uncharacterized protein LOC107713780 [Sinocyclocheilus rhinocerous]|uniref:uncharacterized protein LOC107713780 n=1 Tax=Sinocyclocheilus rhinocerous TaxID=307959 RepID=UPI0007B90D91|nr:PREDICTED: uncharacterized protein LOC107713780 [Sinocyclocheilus rhinocerous]